MLVKVEMITEPEGRRNRVTTSILAPLKKKPVRTPATIKRLSSWSGPGTVEGVTTASSASGWLFIAFLAAFATLPGLPFARGIIWDGSTHIPSSRFGCAIWLGIGGMAAWQEDRCLRMTRGTIYFHPSQNPWELPNYFNTADTAILNLKSNKVLLDGRTAEEAD